MQMGQFYSKIVHILIFKCFDIGDYVKILLICPKAEPVSLLLVISSLKFW